MKASIIVARDKDTGLIGYEGQLPWPFVPADMKRFKEKTYGHVVIMGLKTLESLSYNPLPGRVNVVVCSEESSRTLLRRSDVLIANTVEDAFGIAGFVSALAGRDEFFIIGGESIFNYCQDHLLVDKIYLTEIYTNGALPEEAALQDSSRFFQILPLRNWECVTAIQTVEADALNRFRVQFIELEVVT